MIHHLVGWWRVVTGIALLAVVAWWTGAGPFLTGFRSLDPATLLVAVALAVPATVAVAWRWRLVARGLQVGVAFRPAVASCYRAQFLNATLPGGVVGDVHRGVSHGREAGDVPRSLRAVVWERSAGQVVQAVLAVGVLLLLPSPVRSSMPALLLLLVLGLGAMALLTRRAPARSGSRGWRLLAAVREDVRAGLLVRAAWPGVVVASTVAVAGHVATYVVAARAVGVAAPLSTLLPLVLLVLVAAGVPSNVAGWGPREGMAAWSFGAAGLGVDQGVSTAVAYGAMVVVASLPGALVLLASRRRGHG